MQEITECARQFYAAEPVLANLLVSMVSVAAAYFSLTIVKYVSRFSWWALRATFAEIQPSELAAAILTALQSRDSLRYSGDAVDSGEVAVYPAKHEVFVSGLLVNDKLTNLDLTRVVNAATILRNEYLARCRAAEISAIVARVKRA